MSNHEWNDRAERGVPRGAEAVFDEAHETLRDGASATSPLWRRPAMVVAAAAAALVVGLIVLSGTDEPSDNLTANQPDPSVEITQTEEPVLPEEPVPTTCLCETPDPEPTVMPVATETATSVPAVATPVPSTSIPTGTTPTPIPVATATPAPNPTAAPTLTPVDCGPTAIPLGALPTEAPPVHCRIVNTAPDTAVIGANSWEDNFDHGGSFASFEGTPYVVFDALQDMERSIHWRHNNHWMVDISPNPDTAGTGGSMMRPNQTFTFEDGKLVVEVDVAAGVDGYNPAVWPEIDITPAGAPSGPRIGALYGYDHFPGAYTLGCRLQADGVPVCSLFNDTNLSIDGGRIWEMSFFQEVGTTVFGGGSWVDDGQYYRTCAAGQSDAECRDRFRLELTETSLTLYVNGLKYFEQTGIPALPAELVEGEVYVYFSSMASRSGAETIRYHWDRVAVNPTSGPSASPTW